MKTLLRIRPITLYLLCVVSCLCISCSHLNVDFDSSWSARAITVVVVEHDHAPDEVSTADIVNILNRSGWHVVADRDQAQARVVCRWSRQPDLTSESEPIEVVKSFHVQVISVAQPKVLAVSDYFYSDSNEQLLDGVHAALTALTQARVVNVPQAAAAKVHPVSAPEVEASVVVPVVPAVEKLSTDTQKDAQSPSVVAAVTASHADIQALSGEQEILVQETLVDTSLPTSSTERQQVQPLESAGPVTMEKSPWVPRFQGMGLEEWGKE